MNNDITYITAKEFAERNSVTLANVYQNCKRGSYKGAYQDEKGRWHIPRELIVLRSDDRRSRTIRASDDEWALINRFEQLIKRVNPKDIRIVKIKELLGSDE